MTENVEDAVLRSLPQPKARSRKEMGDSFTKSYPKMKRGSHRNKRVRNKSTIRVDENGMWQFIGDENQRNRVILTNG